jgi:hypothetical protein
LPNAAPASGIKNPDIRDFYFKSILSRPNITRKITEKILKFNYSAIPLFRHPATASEFINAQDCATYCIHFKIITAFAVNFQPFTAPGQKSLKDCEKDIIRSILSVYVTYFVISLRFV